MSSSTRGAEGNPSTLVHGDTTGRTFHDVHEENPNRVFAAYNAVQTDTQRRILYALAQNGGRVSYKELERELSVSDRTKRKHVTTLVDANIVERIETNFTIVSFKDDDSEVIVREALTRWFDKDV